MPERDPDLSPFEHGPTRRTVLRAAGLVALTGGGVGVLAACSSDAGVAAPAATGAAPSSAAPASSAPASPSPSASASSSAPAAPSGPSVAAADVPVGSGVILEDAKYVVTQPTKGEFKAFSSICTHQGCPVSEIQGDAILCNCHGSKFSIKDGSVLNPPASEPLAQASATVEGDTVVVQA
ncbi:Rieske (2Fe-2S) protein [Microlunatus capsulatus]|uniref:Cytochrome bc1 complex Rieske iron-sulfur subunit n=1 Tax=Microlunatus capsulatus TaxID=99117 RepID=A0ABS4ZE00_9ACTN|nr:Rieske (2Fe-2S) protein [Microlunatus capsulatus]MBP2418438.1 Rieske Fe-S protein [Microlunatus capsulatus]